MHSNEYTYPDGSRYEGEFKDGKRHGRGAWIRPDGTKYVGEWLNDKPCGRGILIFPDGRKYEGGWKEGKRHGPGTETLPEGKILSGEWADGKFIGDQRPAVSQEVKIQELERENQALKQEVVNLKSMIADIEKQATPPKPFIVNEEKDKTAPSEIFSSSNYRDKPTEGKKKPWWAIAAIAAVIVVAAVIFLIWGERDSSDEITTPVEDSATETATQEPDINDVLTENDVINIFTAAGLPLGTVVVYTEETCPNDLLGRPGQYIGKASWEDTSTASHKFVL